MVSLDTIFDLLSEERRRYVLYYLKEQDGPVSVTELTEAVADREKASSPEDVPDETLERIDVSLRHNHVPKTTDAEFVEYDRADGVIRLRGSPPEFEALVTIAEIIENPDIDE
ncbi:hypothetical protein DMJ13_03680 [halophilic archaeon]|nr:hypothetical protein DMJ13_03680 [halophilic archaeon]